MVHAKFPTELCITDNNTFPRFCVEGTPKQVDVFEGVEEGDAVAVYKLVHVYTYRTSPRLDKN